MSRLWQATQLALVISVLVMAWSFPSLASNKHKQSLEKEVTNFSLEVKARDGCSWVKDCGGAGDR